MKKSNCAYKTYLIRIMAILSVLSSYFWIIPGQVHAAAAGFQEYYVLGNEEQIYNMFDHIDTVEGGSDMIYGHRMRSVVAIVATADNQVIYYDHWEDGYEANIFTPTQNSTEIYGDGNPGNGGVGPDILSVGSIISLKSDGSGSGVNAVVPVNPRGTALRYDGGDYLLSIGGPVDLVHATWPRSTTWIGGAWEVYSLQALAHSFSYHIPVGEGLAADFKYVWLQVEALYDNTTVTIDNGAESIVVNLNKGQTYSSRGRIDSRASTPITVNEGTTVSSDRQVQVGLVTGGPDEFQTRFFVIVPDLIWGTEYVVAVPRTTDGEETEIYLYNPNDHSITVETHDASGDDSIAIAAGEVAIYSQEVGYVPIGSAVHLNSDDVFWGLVSADTANDDYDWGFSLIPTLFLMDEYYVSWAPGNLNITDNAAPVWVASVADNTTFYVDYGPVDGQVDQTFTIDALDTRRIFDPDNDNTGMHIWATGKFVPIWGIDPASGRPGEGYLDLGYSILPLYQGWLDPVLSLEKTADPEALPVEGGTATFILQAKTYGLAPVNHVDITDILPIGWTYVAGSTIVTYPDGSTDSLDPVQSCQNLFWNLSHEMGSNQTLSLQFDAQILTGGGVGSRHFDGFETNNYSGGTGGWLGDWIESEGNGPAAGDIRIVGAADVVPYNGDRQLQIADDDQTIYREIDLSSFSQPVLRFKRYFRLLEGGETFGVDVSVDNGSSYTPVLSWSYPAVAPNTWVQEEVDLSAYITDRARLRFRGFSGVSPQDYFHVDDVEVYDAVVVNENAGQVAGEYRGYVFNATDDAVVYISALDLEKMADRSVVGIGDTIEYTLSCRNNGAITMTGTYINDTIPWGTTFSGASSGGSYNSATNAVNWTLGDVAPSQTGSVTFTVTVDDRTPPGTVIENLGRINSDQTEQVSSNVVETTVLPPTTTLSISKGAEDVDGPPLVVSDPIRYTWQVTNTGTYTAFNVTVTDDLPEGVTFESQATDLGNATDGDPVGWTISELATDTVATLWITVTINPDQAGQTITNTGSVTGSNVFDPPPPPPAVCPDGSEPDPVSGECLVKPVACACPPDRYEHDDDADHAAGLEADVRQTHDFCDDAADWITFTVQAGNVYTITTSSWGQRADTFLALFDSDAYTLLAANDDYEGTTDYSSRIVWQAPADGVYYVHTTNRAGLIGCATDYDLLVESQAQPGPEQIFYYLPIVMRSYGGGGGASDGNDVYPTGVISHTCPDGYETDDTWQQAQPVEADVVQVHSFDSNPQRYAADKDFVWFDVSAGRAITFTVTAITNTQTLLELYDDHGAALNVAGTTQLVWTPATPGRYYLSVSPLTTTFGCANVVGYNLLVTGMEQMAPETGIYLPIIMRNYD